jgi:uncharacterized protein YndB with AHSA1/START domain
MLDTAELPPAADRGYQRWMLRPLVAITALLAAAAALPSVARAEVADATAGGFTVKLTASVAAPAAKAWAALIEPRSWWDKNHTWSGDAANLSLDATVGGCFCEKLAAGGGVRHLTVVYVDPNKLLRMTGGLGPLQDMAVQGVMTIKLTEAAGKTALELVYRVGGYTPGGLATFARPVDGVLGDQLMRLKRRIETGKP